MEAGQEGRGSRYAWSSEGSASGPRGRREFRGGFEQDRNGELLIVACYGPILINIPYIARLARFGRSRHFVGHGFHQRPQLHPEPPTQGPSNALVLCYRVARYQEDRSKLVG